MSTSRGATRPGRHVLTRRIINLQGYDLAFLRNCERVFEVDGEVDVAGYRRLREWLLAAMHDIVGIYCINPNTIYGTIQEGPDVRDYPRLSEFPLEQVQEFFHLWKVFATHVYEAMRRIMEPYEDQVYEREDWVDLDCRVVDYQLGCVAVEISAKEQFYPPEREYSHQWP